MPDMSKHASPATGAGERVASLEAELEDLPRSVRSVVVAAWIVLLSMAVPSIVFNIWHATHVPAGQESLALGLAVLEGLAPVISAMGISHIIAEHRGNEWMQVAAFLIMAAAMGCSANAIATVVAGSEGPVFRWVFALGLDGAALFCLRVIIVEKQRATKWERTSKALGRARAEAGRRAAEDASRRAMEEQERRAMEEAAQRAKEEEAERRREAARQRAAAAAAGITPETTDPDSVEARKAYRESVRAGKPLTDRNLGEMFGRSRTWGANRIKEANGKPALRSVASGGN